MEKVLVDAFIVPEESREAFLEGARRVQRFLKTLPGFVEGFQPHLPDLARVALIP